jgi:hypothetical protein
VTTHPQAPTPLEIAVGAVLGEEGSAPALRAAGGRDSPREALERALLPALEQAPCAVTFSGGRDSSVVLAVAAALARREGLEPPVAVSARFANAPGTGESEWQELVVRHLGIDRWERVELEDELDLVGPVSAALLRRHGVLHPPHTSLFALLAERVPCRSLVTGFGGDQVLGGWIASREGGRLSRSRRPRTALVTLYAAAPRPLRRLALRSDLPERPWLTEPARREYARRWLEAAASEPASWPRYLAWVARRRSLASVRQSLELALAGRDVAVFHPLMDRRVLDALARAGGRRGLGDRRTVTGLLAGDDLPGSVAARRTKAHFHHAYFRAPSRDFARRWDGSGLDPALVRSEELRRAWLGRMPRGSSALALQAAWLASAGGGELEEPAGGVGDPLEATRAH